jgi:hypothetical protein
LVCALACLVPAVARAEGPRQLAVAAAGSCPSTAEVTVELQELLPDATLQASEDVVDADVVVADRGAGFTVKVRGQRRRFRDTKRDCTERAKHIAVFTVLIVDPLHVPAHIEPPEEEPEPVKPVEPVEPPPVLAPPKPKTRGPQLDLSLGPLAQVAIKSDSEGSTQAGGLGFRLRYGSGVGITLGLAGLLPTSLHFRQAEASAIWVPMDIGLSLAQRSESWEVSLDLGLGAALLLVEGEALDATQQASRMEVGGRGAVQVRYWASDRAGIYGGLFGSWFPKPYTLQVEGIGVVGRTPTGWLGGSIGAMIRL